MTDTEPSTHPPHRALLARLEADRVKALRNAPLCTVEEVRWVNEGMAVAHLADIGHLLHVFEGPAAAAEYMRQTGQRDALDVEDAPDDALLEQYATAIRALKAGGTLADLDEDDDVYALTRAVLAVRDHRVEQLSARIAELEKQVAEDADDYAKLADHNEATCEAVQRRDTAEAALERVRDLAADMRTWCSPRGIAVDYADRIDEALEGPAAERTEGAR